MWATAVGGRTRKASMYTAICQGSERDMLEGNQGHRSREDGCNEDSNIFVGEKRIGGLASFIVKLGWQHTSISAKCMELPEV